MKEYLPLGTIVVLNEGTKPIMIYGRKQKHAQTGAIYDYVACLYPEGNLSNEYNCLFNHDQIKEVLFMGYVNEVETAFVKFLNEYTGE